MRPSPAPRSLTQDLRQPPGEAQGRPPNRSLPRVPQGGPGPPPGGQPCLGRGHGAKAWVTLHSRACDLRARDRPWGSGVATWHCLRRLCHSRSCGAVVLAKQGQEGQRLAGDPGSSSRPSSVCKECLVLSFSCVESRGGWQPSPAAQWHWVWGGQSWSSGLLPRCESGKPSKCGGGGGEVRPLASQTLRWVPMPWASPWVTPSLPREPVVPPGGHTQLPAGLQLGARVQ